MGGRSREREGKWVRGRDNETGGKRVEGMGEMGESEIRKEVGEKLRGKKREGKIEGKQREREK